MFVKNRISFRGLVLLFVLCVLTSMLFGFAKEEKEKKDETTSTNAIVDPIKTDAGLISGMMLGEAGKEVRAYLGIPYAAPPVGDLRWKPPQPVTSWSGARDCTQYSNCPIQQERGGGVFNYPQDEDCLYLNVITPAKSADQMLPVMVWFHGGGNSGSGNNALFNGYRLPRHGVIVVSVNTRLGIFGLLAHPLLSAESNQHVSGNYMLLDMLASLKWVKNNIKAFGGDPDNVTIFGVSSGSQKVAALVASPLGKGLFKKAICQSGPALFFKGLPLSKLENYGKQFFDRLGVTTVEDARKISWQDINELGAGAVYKYALDGWVIKDDPAKTFTAGKQNPVQMLVGFNQGELDRKEIGIKLVSGYVSMLTGVREAGAEAYAYIFDQVPANWRKKGGKAIHALDILYVFGDYDHKTTDDWPYMYLEETQYGIGPEDKDPVLTETDKKVSEEMMAVWAQFARTGNPSVKGLITVPAWEPDSDKYLYIADPLQVKSGFSTSGQ